MVSTFTPNIQLEEPARGDEVGTWDTAVNGNTTTLDLVCGGIVTVLSSANIVLASSQYKNKTLTFSGTLTVSILVTFPTSFTKSYEIQNLCANSTQFVIQLQTPSSLGGTFICPPPGQISEIINDGVNIKFKNLPPVGTYVNYAGASLPLWAANCGTNGVGVIPLPFLNCDGSTFNASFYPQLNAILGGTTLPDWRGRAGASYNQGTARINATINGDVLYSGGGDQNLQAHVHTGTTATENAAHNHNFVETTAGTQAVAPGGTTAAAPLSNSNVNTGTENQAHAHTFTTANAGAGGSQNMSPTLIYGITMIRAG